MITSVKYDNKFKKLLKKQKKELKTIPKKAYGVFKSITPIDKGNAKRHTTLKRDDIIADYPYAERLDNGWSKQAPKGMVIPTMEYMTKLFKRIIRTGK